MIYGMNEFYGTSRNFSFKSSSPLASSTHVHEADATTTKSSDRFILAHKVFQFIDSRSASSTMAG
jgi:hypothetical protein